MRALLSSGSLTAFAVEMGMENIGCKELPGLYNPPEKVTSDVYDLNCASPHPQIFMLKILTPKVHQNGTVLGR